MTLSKPALAFLGGTFDPVHQGHINPLLQLADTFHWQHIHLLPSCLPPHREQPEASDEQRLAMLKLVAKQDHRLVVNDWEISQGKPSRTKRTLDYFRTTYPNHQLFFVMGMDSWVTLHQWVNWQHLNQSADLVILPRPGYKATQAAASVQQWLTEQTNIHFPTISETNISATELRQQIKHWQHGDPVPALLFAETFSYILSHNLYR